MYHVVNSVDESEADFTSDHGAAAVQTETELHAEHHESDHSAQVGVCLCVVTVM
jgi:hypothetical protein